MGGDPCPAPGCGRPVRAVPGYESRTTYCSRACQVRANRRRRKKRTDLLPAESMALMVALAQVRRGDDPGPNTAAVCVLALARITGRHDYTQEATER